MIELAASLSDSSRHEDSYVGSLPYYLLTGRRGLKLYRDADCSLMVAAHPHVDERLLVFPEIQGDGSLTARVLNALDFPNGGIQLARYTKRDHASLKEAIERLVGRGRMIMKKIDEEKLDWRYPAHVLDTERVACLKGRVLEKSRNKFNKAVSLLTVAPLHSECSIRAIRSSMKFWMGAMINAGKESGDDMEEFYNALVKAIQQYPSLFDGFVTYHGEEPAGFTVWDLPVRGVANALAGLSRKSVRGMSEFQIITACRILSDRGVKYFNLGGSETASLDEHKRKYRPVQSVSLCSYKIRKSTIKDFSVFEMPTIDSL